MPLFVNCLVTSVQGWPGNELLYIEEDRVIHAWV